MENSKSSSAISSTLSLKDKTSTALPKNSKDSVPITQSTYHMSNLTYTINHFVGIRTFIKLCIYTNSFRINAFIQHNLNFKEGLSSSLV